MNDFLGFEIINIENLDNYTFKGVWALFGKEKNTMSNKYRCLNVGKSNSIGKEIKIDIQRLENFKEFDCVNYTNQFNEIMFKYKKFATRLDFLYKHISERYTDFVFIIVYKGMNDYNIEKYFAYSTKSAYWVSNGRYSTKKNISDEKIDEIIEGIDVSKIDSKLIKKIKFLKKEMDQEYKFSIKP